MSQFWIEAAPWIVVLLLTLAVLIAWITVYYFEEYIDPEEEREEWK